MPFYSQNSTSKLLTCDHAIQLVCYEVVKSWDNSVLYGYRGESEQNELFRTGKSKVMFPDSRHNVYPSRAVDLAPHGCWGPGRAKIVWPDPKVSTYAKDLAQWYYFAGFVLGTANGLGVRLRHGGDWNKNRHINDQTFDDLAHFELLD